MQDSLFSDLFSLDNIIAIQFVVFMLLWHRRTMARDEQFFHTMQQMISLLNECQDTLSRHSQVEATTPRN
jgi:hypothetical protein